MLDSDSLKIETFFANATMPYGIRVTHKPTGLSVEGNCKNGNNQMNLQRTLVDQLAIFVSEKVPQSQAMTYKVENDQLKAQLAALMARVETMEKRQSPETYIAPQPKETVKAAPKKRGRPPKVKPAVVDTPTGQKTEAELIAEQMRPPTDRPMALPKSGSHGSTVAKSNVKYIQE